MNRPRAAFFSFGSCEGCQLQVLSVEERLLELLTVVQIVNFREAIDERRDDYEIAFVEGSVIRPDDAAEVRQIRKRARILVALGACACLGGVNAIRNRRSARELADAVYGGRQDGVFEALTASPISSVAQVDYEIKGCPIDRAEFVDAVRSLLAGTAPTTPALEYAWHGGPPIRTHLLHPATTPAMRASTSARSHSPRVACQVSYAALPACSGHAVKSAS